MALNYEQFVSNFQKEISDNLAIWHEKTYATDKYFETFPKATLQNLKDIKAEEVAYIQAMAETRKSRGEETGMAALIKSKGYNLPDLPEIYQHYGLAEETSQLRARTLRRASVRETNRYIKEELGFKGEIPSRDI